MIGPFDLLSFKSKTNCCGCIVCKNACPVSAISITEDYEGFMYPVVDIAACVNCKLCEKVCPNINIKKNSCSDYAYCAYSKDQAIRNDASSGGIFELLAREIINKDGIVFGAAFDEQLTLKHTYADNFNDLKKLCKSKYIQSDTNGVYYKVKKLLINNKLVLFVGTPCQVSALNNYLGEKYNNLLTVDFICHGVPSYKMFKSYIKSEEQKHDGKIKSFSFRVKDGKVKHVHGYSYIIESKGKEKIHRGMFYDNAFYFGFKKYLTLRPSCYFCKYCTPERVSDITLADFWGIEEYLPNIDFNKGVSMVLVNSEKGATAFKFIEHNIISQKFDMEIAIKCNHCLTAPTKLPQIRVKLMEDYHNMPFEDFARKYILSNKLFIYKLYYSLPLFIRKLSTKMWKEKSYV